MAREILTGARIFDGRRLIDGHALVIDNGEILAILPRDKVPDRNRREVPGIIADAVRGAVSGQGRQAGLAPG